MAGERSGAISRRMMLKGAAAAGVGLAAGAWGAESPAPAGPVKRTFAGTRNRFTFTHPLLREPVRLMVIGDSHLTLDDARGEAWKSYSGRMSTPYRKMRHWRTGKELVSPAGFEEALEAAQKAKVDFLALVGDIVSFPSEAGVEFVSERLKRSGLNWMYVSGNHDWHYEGLPGSLKELRDEWAPKRLGPLYQGANPLFAVRKVKGVRMVMIDDSTWEILPEQLVFLKEQIASGEPLALFMHIPLYVRGYPPGVAEVGDPGWGWDRDPSWQVERRPRWPKTGHTETTRAFRDAVFAAPNVIGVFAGHVHCPMQAEENGVVQLCTDVNANGSFLDVRFEGGA
ncbi:MAG: metallophosphoesterase [Kiritimatiellae bacterium]|nr:metallophosphoesterase [Kiritimatiellia bacterium]